MVCHFQLSAQYFNLPEGEAKMYFIELSQTSDSSYQLQFQIDIVKDGKEQRFLTSTLDTFLVILLQDLYQAEEYKNDLLVFIHGMWGSKKMIFRNTVGELMQAYVHPQHSKIKRIISVQWPGNEWSYRKNKEQAELISNELSKVMTQLFRTTQIINHLNYKSSVDVHLMCHSLGNYVLEKMTEKMDTYEFNYPLVDELILAAPDLDVFAMEEGMTMRNISKLSNRAHIYFNRKDLTLKVSKDLNDRGRMGLTGVSRNTKTIPRVYYVDVTAVNDDINFSAKLSKHFYYRTSPTITNDMLEVLNGRNISEFTLREAGRITNEFLLYEAEAKY